MIPPFALSLLLERASHLCVCLIVVVRMDIEHVLCQTSDIRCLLVWSVMTAVTCVWVEHQHRQLASSLVLRWIHRERQSTAYTGEHRAMRELVRHRLERGS